ncbi:MAG TPA: HEAT repeat domain-containing protein [Blastocatellia bacterium]|nr:HEAT repeat domain-containing protein [Blastocatellia bacterium]
MKRAFLISFAAALSAVSASRAIEGVSTAQVQVRPAPAPPALLAELKSADAATRRRAASELGQLRARDAVRPLSEALLDRNAGVREAAAFALGQITDRRALDPLLAALADKDAEVRASAAFALGMLGDRRATRALSNALGDSSEAVRSSAVAGLGIMEDREAVEEIIAMLDDPSIDVRYDAVWALGQIGVTDATDHLHAALVNLDLVKIDDNQLEAYRQAVQNSLERLRAFDERLSGLSRPRRATAPRDEEQARVMANISQPMSVVQSVQPAPTERALRARISGSVKLRVLVGVESRAVRAYVTRRLGYGLDQRAIQAVMQYRFDPEIKKGLPQTIWTDMEITF